MKAKITKVSKEEKRHILQMTDKELNYVQKSLQNFLGRYFYNGGSFRICRHAKRRFFQKNEEIRFLICFYFVYLWLMTLIPTIIEKTKA